MVIVSVVELASLMSNSAGDVVTSRLSNGRAGITKVLQMDISAGMLQRDQTRAQVIGKASV